MSWSILGFIWYRFTSPDRILRVEGERDAEAEQEAREAAEAAERKALARINKEYGEVYDEVKGCEAAVERLHSNEPEDMMEAASVVLSSHKILWGDDGVRRGMKSETGYGEGERRKMFGMFASRENGGVSLRRLAEDPMKEVCEAHGIVYDSREAMDALLDVLQAAAVPSDIRKYIEKRRMAQALELKRQEDAYLREQYEEWCREMYHMSADEYEAYEEYMSEELKNLDENFDEKEYFDNIADEISNIEKNGYREIQKDDAEREGRGNGGSGEVLSAERAVQRGGDATDAGQPGLSERDGIQGDGAERPVLESTPGRSEVRPGFDGGVAEAEGIGTEPTEAQKEAGNYKMDHRRIDGYDISIENAKGSVRSGKNPDGTKWETLMHNDYGYIRGTEGVDGDHIDVFLSDTPEEGDVFVVDQVREDGSFDEHKVMYGFPTEEAARDAYLSNYEPGWSGLGAITHVSKDEFKKWIRSSKRKTKPFVQYKSVKPIEGNDMIGRSLAEQEAMELIARMEATAEVAPSIELTPENWISQFGEDGNVETPIGVVKMGANQLVKLYSTKRTGYFGMIHPTLSTPDVILEEADPKEGSERDSKYLFVKTFVKSDGSRIVHFESVTVKKDGMEVSISSHEIKDRSLKNKMQNDIVLHLDEKLSPGSEMRLTEAPSESEGPDLVPTSDNNIVENEREDGQSLILPSEESEETGALSGPTFDSPVDRKGNALPGDTQADGAESSEPYTITATTYTNKRGKTSDVYFVKFGRELTAGEMDAAYDYIDEPLEDGKKTKRGWYDRKQGGYMMRSEEAARGLGELIGGGEADSEGAVVAGVADVAEVNAAQRAVRDMLVAKEAKYAEMDKTVEAAADVSLSGEDEESGDGSTRYRDGGEMSDGERLRAIRALEPIVVEHNDLSKDELREVYGSLPGVEKDGRLVEFYRSAFKKIYKEGGLFGQVVPVLDDVLDNSVLAYSEADKLGGMERPDGTIHKEHPNVDSFDNYVGKVNIGGKEYYVRTTVKREIGQAGTHSFFVSDVSLYEKDAPRLTLPNFPSGESYMERSINPTESRTIPITSRGSTDFNGVLDAKLRQFFERANSEAKILDMRDRAEDLSERLGTPVRLVETREEAAKLPTRRERRAKGFYNTETGEVVVVLPNHANVADVENTVLHEVVGHEGLRVLFPTEEKLNNALDELYGASEDRIREDIDARTQRMVDA